MNERKKASTKATVQKSTKEKLTEALLRGRSATARQFKPPESWEELAKIYRHCLDLAANSEPRERNKILALFRTVQKSKGGRPPLRPEISYEELVEKIDQQIADRRASTGKKPARKPPQTSGSWPQPACGVAQCAYMSSSGL